MKTASLTAPSPTMVNPVIATTISESTACQDLQRIKNKILQSYSNKVTMSHYLTYAHSLSDPPLVDIT